MAEETRNSDHGSPESHGPEEDRDTGEPIAMLLDFAEEPAPAFIGRIRNALHRRLLASELVGLSWSTPVLVFLEYLKVIFGIFGVESRERRGAE